MYSIFDVKAIAVDKSRFYDCNKQLKGVVTPKILAVVQSDIWKSTFWTADNNCKAVEQVDLSSHREMVSREITTEFRSSKKISTDTCHLTHLVAHNFLNLVAFVFVSTLVFVLKRTSCRFGVLKKLYTVPNTPIQFRIL